MKLAQRLGYANPDAMLAEMTVEQFEEHRAVYDDDPWDGARRDWGFALIASVVLNKLNFGKAKPVKPTDLMPKFGAAAAVTRRPKSVEAEVAAAMAWVASVGGTIKAGGGPAALPAPVLPPQPPPASIR